MKLSALYVKLAFGELSNLLSDEERALGDLPDLLKSKVNAQINESLAAIYSRITLLEKEVIIEARDDVQIYYLQKKYAVTDATVMPYKYIRDTEDDPFLQDVIQIRTAYDEEGTELGINRTDLEGTLFTPKFDAVQIPLPVTGSTYTILYQASHPPIAEDDPDQEIELPIYLHTALRAHLAGSILGSMNGAEHVARSAEHMTRYETIMAETEFKDLALSSLPIQNDKFTTRGFI
jgi:hypothetical protein